MRILTVLLVLFSVNISFSFMSRFLLIDTNSVEYRLLVNPESFTLKEGALIASGVTPEFMGGYLAQISNVEEQIRPLVQNKSRLDAAYILFTEMHKKLLKKYDETSTTLDVLLKTGKYNCLSSTVMYGILLEDFGIPFKAAVLPTHVFTILDDNGKEMDVENTTPFGFNISTNIEAQQTFKKLTGFEYSADDSIREVTGKKGLIAYTYGNVAYFAAKLDQTVPSFQSVLKAVAVFDGGRYVYTNVVAGYSQYIYYLTDGTKNYDQALAISEEALQNLPRKEMFLSNYYYTLDRYLNALAEQGKSQEAFAVYERSKKVTGPNRVIEDNLYTRILYRLINKEQDLVKAYDFGKKAIQDVPGSQNIKNLLINGFNMLGRKQARDWENYPNGETFFLKWYALLDDPNMLIIYENYYVEVSVRFFENGKYDKALDINRKALTQYPDSQVLKKNMVYVAGNTAGMYFKKEDYDNGLKYSKIALAYDPKNATVIGNIRIVYRMRANDWIEKKNYAKALLIVNEGLTFVPDDKELLKDKDYCTRKLR